MATGTPPELPSSDSSGRGTSPVLVWALVLLIALFAFKFWAIWRGERAPTDTWLEAGGTAASEAAEGGVSALASLRYLFSIPSLVEENRRLERENTQLKARLSNLQGVAEENRRLRAALELELPGEMSFTAAEVESRSSDEFFSRLTVNRGSEDGVEMHQLVVDPGGAVVGEVVEVMPGSSRVRLVTHPSFAAGAVTGDHDAAGVVVGDPPDSMLLQYLPADSPIAVNDKLYTSGVGGELTRGLFLGRVRSVVKQPELERVRVRVEPAANLTLLEQLLVVRGR